VLCLAGRVVSPTDATVILGVFLETPFDGGRHERRVKLIDDFK
jgi:ribose 5-phosphate isomerase B